jgi:SAM-dependent methyltransferase
VTEPNDVIELPDIPQLPERPVDPDWLALREPADSRSRDAAADLVVAPLLRWLAGRLSPVGPGTGLQVVDLGAGTGANLRWLAPRLAAIGGSAALSQQHWTLVDHDPRLRAWGPARTVTVRADVADLGLLLSRRRADLVTAAALLDLLDLPQLTAIAGAVVAHGVPALFTLSVTGAVTLDPADPLDLPLAEAFDAHQRRDGRLGPDAGEQAARLFREHGWDVAQAPTPWNLVSAEAAMMDTWLEGRAEAAAEWDPGLADHAQAWLERRRRELAAGALRAMVGHLDVLALPPAASAAVPRIVG